MLIFGFFDRIKTKIPSVSPLIIAFVTLACFAIPSSRYSYIVWLFATIILVPALVVFSSVSQSNNETISKISDYIGWLSYPLYCVHFPIYSFITALNNNETTLGVIVMSIVLSVAVAHLAAKYFDEPIRRWIAG